MRRQRQGARRTRAAPARAAHQGSTRRGRAEASHGNCALAVKAAEPSLMEAAAHGAFRPRRRPREASSADGGVHSGMLSDKRYDMAVAATPTAAA